MTLVKKYAIRKSTLALYNAGYPGQRPLWRWDQTTSFLHNDGKFIQFDSEDAAYDHLLQYAKDGSNQYEIVPVYVQIE